MALINNMSMAIFKNGSTIILSFPAELSEILYFINDMCCGRYDKLSDWIWHFPIVLNNDETVWI